ncbi:MAG: VOC family protein [Chloroflexi bacterium]|nr:VOC family protein [Chloroflexota bacterium]
MRIKQVEHIDLLVSDIHEAVEFWRKLGFYPEGTLDGGKSVYLINGVPDSPLKIELHETKPGQQPGIDHISLEVEDVPAAYAEGKYLGIKFHIEPRQIPRSGRMIANFYGPDGLHLQVSKKMQRAEYEDWK